MDKRRNGGACGDDGSGAVPTNCDGQKSLFEILREKTELTSDSRDKYLQFSNYIQAVCPQLLFADIGNIDKEKGVFINQAKQPDKQSLFEMGDKTMLNSIAEYVLLLLYHDAQIMLEVSAPKCSLYWIVSFEKQAAGQRNRELSIEVTNDPFVALDTKNADFLSSRATSRWAIELVVGPWNTPESINQDAVDKLRVLRDAGLRKKHAWDIARKDNKIVFM